VTDLTSYRNCLRARPALVIEFTTVYPQVCRSQDLRYATYNVPQKRDGALPCLALPSSITFPACAYAAGERRGLQSDDLVNFKLRMLTRQDDRSI
jgi:hypothetical protein